MAAFFMKVQATANVKQAGQATASRPEVTEISQPQARQAMPLPESAKNVPAKFLGGEQPKSSQAVRCARSWPTG